MLYSAPRRRLLAIVIGSLVMKPPLPRSSGCAKFTFRPAFREGLNRAKALFVELFTVLNDALYVAPVGVSWEKRNSDGWLSAFKEAAPASASFAGVSVRVALKLANRSGSKIPEARRI